MKFRYYLINKPFGYLSQFSGEESDLLLGRLFDFPKDVYPVGRLDKDSEGLLLLTNDNYLKTKLLNPENNHEKTYWVQVEGAITPNAINSLIKGGVPIKHNKKTYHIKPCLCKLITPAIEDRQPPIRFRSNIPTSWLEITLTEGKNRQIRKMTAAVGFPTLRLIRVSIGEIKIENLNDTKVKELSKADFLKALSVGGNL